VSITVPENADKPVENPAEQSGGVSRRSILGRAGVLTAVGIASPLLSNPASAHEPDEKLAHAGKDHSHLNRDDQYGTLHAKTLVKKSYKSRVDSASKQYTKDIPPHPNNGDEARYPNKIGTATKGLKHDANGHVDPESYASLLKALRSRKHEDFENVILGGTRPLADPQGPLTTALVGASNAQLAIPVAERLDSAALAAEHIEIYWQALLRDVPFSEYHDNTNNPLVLAAVDELNRLADYRGPKINGKVTPQTLFRSTALYVDYKADRGGKKGKYVVPPETLKGPYISQFLLRSVPSWGTFPAQAQLRPIQTAGESFGTTYEEWLAIRNGIDTGRAITTESGRRHVINGRDLAWIARSSGPTYLHALQILLAAPAADPLAGGIGAPLNPANPYVNSTAQSTGSSFSSSFIQGLIALAASLAIKTSYYQNWFVDRRLRPEDYGGLVHKVLANGADYPIHPDILGSDAVARTFAEFGSYLLPLANNVGAPTHPGYPSGATISAATPVTLLKAWFDETYVIPNPVQVDPADPTKLIPWDGEPLTVGGELNKLVNNIGFGRNFNGFHTRADISASHALGESLAISILQDHRPTYNETFKGFTFTKFDGTAITV
jgi:hypothetical protein